MISEPDIIVPESNFEASIVNAVRELVNQMGCAYHIVPKFGLDLAVFIERGGDMYARFLEMKVYAAGRPGGIGFGSPKGEGPQVELLMCPDEVLALLDAAVRWVLADGTRPQGSARYALVDCRQAKAATMGGVRKGKQNNLRMSSFQSSFMSWSELLEALRRFLLS